MSLLGHSRPNWAVRAMSAFHPLATTERTSHHVGFVQKGDMSHVSNLDVWTQTERPPRGGPSEI